MKRNVLVLTMAVFGLVNAGREVMAQDCTGVLPDPTSNHPIDTCEYTHVPFETFSLSQGHLHSTWSSDYEITELYLVADWEIIGSYTPGGEALLAFDPTKTRYDFVGRFIELSSGFEFLAITPIKCEGSNVPAPLSGCFTGGASGQTGQGCETTVSRTCSDGSTCTVTCAGDNGTCSDCSAGGQDACCESTETTTTIDPATGTTTTETKLTKKKCAPCPSSSE